MKKKGVELSMNVIIIAAIGLLVLVILAVLVINKFVDVDKADNACNIKGGTCEPACTGETIPEGVCAENLICCKRFTTG